MKQTILFYNLLIFGLFFAGCTQVVTAPVSLATTVVGTTVDVASAAGGAVYDVATSDDDEKEEE
jgi:phosphate/sulfate permease